MPDAKLIVRRLASMRSLRDLHSERWREAFAWTFPERAQSMLLGAEYLTGRADLRREIVDSTGTDAAKTLAAGLVGGMVPANSQWFEMDTGRDDQERANSWLSEKARETWQAIHASNFDSIILEAFVDALGGWCVVYCDEAPEGGFQFEWWPMGECCIASSRPNRPVDTVYRVRPLTVEQIVNAYGIDNVSDATRKKYVDEKYDDIVNVLHAIEPRRDGQRGGMSNRLPIASYILEVDAMHLVHEGGYHEMPCFVPRWMMLPSSAYATGILCDVVRDIKSLNKLTVLEQQSADIAVGGMWKARDDGVLNPATVKLGPRRIAIVDDMDNLQRLDTNTNFQIAETRIQAIQKQIRRSLLADQLEPQDKPQMTAYEVSVRVQMIRQLLGPQFGRFQSEFLNPLVTRCINLANRAGVLGDAPEGIDFYAIQYENPLAKAQKRERSDTIRAFTEHLGNLAAVKQDPDVWDVINLDRANREIADGSGMPTDLLNTPDEIAETRRVRTEATQKAQAEAAQQAQAETAMQGMTLQ